MGQLDAGSEVAEAMDWGSEPESGENHQSAEVTGSVKTGAGGRQRRNSEHSEKRD